jgi:prepilin-type N-terminal cleavage/methylation domain-containing protein
MMYSSTRRSSRAFTLIELLVVLAIIGVLSASAFASLTTARAKGRDSKRLQEIVQLQKAIELYFATYNQYPTGCGGATGAYRGHGSNFSDCNTDYIAGLTPTYIQKLPIDPGGDTTDGYIYQVDAARQNYKVMSYLKLDTYTKNSGEVNARCPSSCANAYCSGAYLARYTAGAACW